MSITITITDPNALSLNEKERIAAFLGLTAAPVQTDYTERLSELIAKEQTLEAVYNMLDVQPGELFARLDALLQQPVVAPAATAVPVPPVPATAGMAEIAASFPPAAPAAVAPPPPAASAMPVFTAQTAAPSADRDARGLPWDSRIHSVNRSKIADGSWRSKKGVDAAVVAAVEAELRATVAAGGGTPAVPAVPAVPSVPVPVVPAVPVPVVPKIFPAPAPVAPAAATAAPDAFGAFMTRLTALLTANRITQPQIQAMCAELTPPLPHIGALFNRQDLIPTMNEKITALVGEA